MSSVFGGFILLCPILQLLHICIEGWGNWRWSEAFSVDNVGTLLRTIQYKGRTASLIIKVVQLNGVQKQVQFFFYWLPVSLCLFGVVILCCITLKVSYFWFDHLSHLLMQHLIMALRELAFNLVQMYTWTEPSMNHFGGQSDDILSKRSTSL